MTPTASLPSTATDNGRPGREGNGGTVVFVLVLVVKPPLHSGFLDE
jgi:hypothetical protein